ncbi:angiopoietin-related protein 4-like [Poeciliopsis prolifica]|uniref:angiopoietin-related protein 4-like n=1 Tax=Poeciliopsis prolifica TaxID=188132 RepID=UPI002413BB98|nr:angiopoietin-related protein 4-like [Poeciliopsis prolifica]
MKMLQVTVLLLSVLVHAGAGFPSDRTRREKHASWDDVNVVAHGLLQLGQGLKEHVDKTKTQMRDVNGRLRAVNGTLAELERRQEQQGEALMAQSKETQGTYRLLSQLGEEVKLEVGEVKRQAEVMTSRMDRLEEVLTEPTKDGNDSEHERVSFIQRLMVAQNRRIDQLVEKIRQQQDKLEKQSLHLQALQDKVAHKRVKSHRRRDEARALKGEAELNQAGLARDCQDLFAQGQRVTGVYMIQPDNSKPFSVLCQMTPDGGWTVIQKRQDGSQNFNQLWESYRTGFGNLNGEFWLGLDHIHSISKQGQYVLHVELSDEAGRRQAARYWFQVDGEERQFALHLDLDPSSGVQEGIESTGASGLPFSTADRDNDLDADANCAALLSGGWWFSSCGESNLNGKFHQRRGGSRAKFQGQFGPLSSTLLKIAPVSKTQ